jgi:phage FluMu protein gp41
MDSVRNSLLWIGLQNVIEVGSANHQEAYFRSLVATDLLRAVADAEDLGHERRKAAVCSPVVPSMLAQSSD